ncbi:hypothetical protein [Microseira sp. BLCC-F43]|jgi:hypothetical protein|uniref:hypothetical protein n=1 Tax=Microseira sp. BLCC-F43 TaxID=3153602 RepID=UPI0035BB847F
MYTYNQVLSGAKTLKPDEQLRLLEELAGLIRQQVSSQNQSTSKEMPKRNLNKWYGFLPKRVDALEFQLKLRQEWDD